MANRNVYKNFVAQQLSVALTTGQQTQQTIDIPSFGADISSVEFDMTLAVTGTPATPTTLSAAIANAYIQSVTGKPLLNNIAGTDIPLLTRLRNIGRTVTDPTVANGASSQFDLPLAIKQSDQDVKLTITVNNLASLAASGISAATLTLNVIFWYYSTDNVAISERIEKLHLSIQSGSNNLSSQLIQNRAVNKFFFRVTTEANYTNLSFTADGNKELDAVTLNQLIGKDNALEVSGHVTGQFVLPVAPFLVTPATQFSCNTTSTDTMDVFLISNLS